MQTSTDQHLASRKPIRKPTVARKRSPKLQTMTPEAIPRPERRENRYPIIVHSHLHWDWVWQRPQQFLSRLSRRHRILFVEEPMPVPGLAAPQALLREIAEMPNITVVRTEFPPETLGDREFVDAEQRRLVTAILAEPLGRAFVRPVQWFYDPMAVTAFAGKMNERAIVYDCMDQLSQFRGAPVELVRRERELLSISDVVFAGGPKIHSAKRLVNANCHCYGCGVDVAHFGLARTVETVVPEDVANLSGPVLGFFGVVDERMDYELVAALADAHPEWNVVIIGPVAKVDANAFPRRANLHWLGGRDYGQLPGYVKGFDVCLMPFARNEATEYINPTKALEYMATGRPIVSTAIEDVVLQFADVVDIADSHRGFIAACERAVARPVKARIKRGLEMAERNSWEAIVRRLEGHISDVLTARQRSEIEAA